MKQALAATLVLILAGWLGACATTQKAPESRPGTSVVQVSSITATVEKINYKTRMVTLKGPGGNEVILKVGEEAQNFDQVRKGDKVTFDYYESIVIDVRKSDAKPMATESQSVTPTTKPGEKPGAVIESTSSLSAKVEKIDYRTRMVTLMGPDGSRTSFMVGDQVERLNEIVAGDLVTVTYTQAVAISVNKP